MRPADITSGATIIETTCLLALPHSLGAQFGEIRSFIEGEVNTKVFLFFAVDVNRWGIIETFLHF